MARVGTFPNRARMAARGQPHLRTMDAAGAAVDLTPEPVLLGNIDIPLLGSLFIAACVAYLGIYALEAPVRYALYNAGKDSLILLRDGLIIGPLVLLGAA